MTTRKIALLTSDKTLGAVGGSLAVASLGFGVYMNTHGPAPGSFGPSGHFTVFAQLAPRTRPKPEAPAKIAAAESAPANTTPAMPATTGPGKATPTVPDESLDMTETASIPKNAGPASPAADEGPDDDIDAATIIASVTLERADVDSATIAVGGRARRVHVGDHVPGAGEVLEIRMGRRPLLKTSRGYIVSARDE